MKKTETINLGGIIFHIEEDAFRQLQTYITSIKNHFADTDSADEIAADIEGRIAELLQEKKISIVTCRDLDDIIAIMGQPEDYADDESLREDTEPEPAVRKKIKRRLYRHPEDKFIAGVCSGLGFYFNIDPLLFRLVFFLTLFVGGFGFYAYVILWLLVPKADSASDFLKMKGEPITSKSIGKAITEKVGTVASQANGSFLKSMIRAIGNFVRIVFELVVKIFGKLLYIIKPVLGIALLSLGLILTVSISFMVLAFTGHLGVSHDLALQINTMNSVFINFPFGERFVYLAFILLIGIPVYQLIYLGMRLIFGLAKQPNFVVGILTSCWILSLISMSIFTLYSFTQFSDRGQKIEAIVLEAVQSDTLNITLKDHPDFYWDDDELCFRQSDDGSLTLVSSVAMELRSSLDEDFHLQITRRARAADYSSAKEFAARIDYDYDITGGTLSLDQFLTYPTDDTYRFQNIDLLLQVPTGKFVSLNKNLTYFLEDIIPVKSRHHLGYYNRAQNLVGRTWMMGEEGLIQNTEE